MIPLNISYLIWTSWKPRLQSHVAMQHALWRNRSYPNSNFPFKLKLSSPRKHNYDEQSNLQSNKVRWTGVYKKIEIIADYFYSILRWYSRCDFFVDVDAICRCDFFGGKRVRCDAISITMQYNCHPWFIDI